MYKPYLYISSVPTLVWSLTLTAGCDEDRLVFIPLGAITSYQLHLADDHPVLQIHAGEEELLVVLCIPGYRPLLAVILRVSVGLISSEDYDN